MWLESGRETPAGDTSTTKGRDNMSTEPGSLHRTSLANFGGAAQSSYLSLSTRRREPPPKKESKFARVPVSPYVYPEPVPQAANLRQNSYVDSDERPKIRAPVPEEEDIVVPSDEEEPEDDIESFL